MRNGLDRLYAVAGWLAAGFIVLICALVSAQVLINTIDKIFAGLFHRGLGWSIPSYADFTGFFLAAATFLALAYALKRGAHIRVTLLYGSMSPGLRRLCDLWALSLCAVVTLYAGWWMALLALESLEFGDLSAGMVPVPLWIPQLSLVAGLFVLAIALIDELIVTFREGRPSFQDQGEGLLEVVENE